MTVLKRRRTPQLPRVIAHRGHSAHAPENTLAAIRAAHAAGCRWVELDVQLLGDGTPVLWHDADVGRCSNGAGRLRDLELDTARRLDVGSWFHCRFAGERIATLEEALTLLAELDMGLNLELKLSPGHAAAALVDTTVAMAVAALPPERLLLSSFSYEALELARDHDADVALGLLCGTLPRHWRRMAEAIAAFGMHVNWLAMTRRAAAEVAASEHRLLCYTVNRAESFAPRWAWGVDAVISDDPGLFDASAPLWASQQRAG
ncbi:glycerophosphoryl diester phosphodiesterase [Halomonas shantousis]